MFVTNLEVLFSNLEAPSSEIRLPIKPGVRESNILRRLRSLLFGDSGPEPGSWQPRLPNDWC